MAGVSNNPNSARQKMINLMYLVFIAMMALNIPAEVLDGFELVEGGLQTSMENSTRRNENVIMALDRAYEANPAKVGEWHKKGTSVKQQSDELINYIEELKLRIVQDADGEKGDLTNVKHKDNLEAPARVMLAPITGEGKKLREKVEEYREAMCRLVGDPSKIAIFQASLNTTARKKAGIIAPSWENSLFENVPVIAAVTLLANLQNDIRYVEGETLSTLITNVDEGDYRVNKIQAFVVPKSQIVTSGMPYEAQIVLAAVDSTKQPEYYLGETLLTSNIITVSTSGTGERTLSGKVVADGETYTYDAKYSVTESSATIAPILMNFLYENYDNDVEIAIPGVPSGAVSASLTGHGSIKIKEKNIWTVSGLSIASSPKVTVTLTANVGGRSISESKEFTVRPLPDPLPFISYKDADGNTRKFKGGTIAKRNLIEAPGIQAAVDDGVMYVPHQVTGFTMTTVDAMGNHVPEVSNSSEFTQRQKELIRNIARGKRFYISNVKAIDPAGKPVTIRYSLEVIIN